MVSVPLAIPLLLVAVAQAMDQPARAQHPRASMTVDLTPSTTNSVTPSDTNPSTFKKLFVRPSLTQATSHQADNADQKRTPKVVCGMVVIPGNPAIDPKIVVPPSPQDSNARIRRIVPNVCVD